MTQQDVEALAEALAERLGRAPRPLLSPAQVAERLAMSERWVRQLLADGELPSLKVGAATRVEAEALDAYIAARKAERSAGD